MTLDIAWARGVDLSQVPSPALLLGLEPIRKNLAHMVKIAGDPARLRPHVKTHKLGWLVQRQLALGITRYKCATIAEAEMCAEAGAPDVLIAFQPVGPNLGRLVALQKKYPQTKFSTIVDDASVVDAMAKAGEPLEVLLDIDVGKHRTGIPPGPGAVVLYRKLAKASPLIAGGLHVYDGHVNQTDTNARATACDEVFKPIWILRDQLLAEGLPVPKIVVGGTPTFPIHAARRDVECSPGTTALWDASYAAKLPDLEFSNAAVLLTRVVSKPGGDRVCIDLGHKAVASEMPHPRVVFPDFPDAQFIAHSEEHLVFESPGAGRLAIGDELLGVPWHVCPTLALHAEATLIVNHKVTSSCRIDARTRKITI
jgi:D-serine deaminase-like pyridoxal phosphate-dependent protein